VKVPKEDIQATYDGTLAVINAVKEGTISRTGCRTQDFQTDLHVMLNHKAGANDEVPEYGDQVVITDQAVETRTTSSWLAGLSEAGETTYTQSWSDSGTLSVEACSLDTGSPGTARIMVYATGHVTLSCDASTPAPTKATVTSPPSGKPIAPVPTEATVTSPPTGKPITPAPTEATVTSPPTKHQSLLQPLAELILPRQR